MVGGVPSRPSHYVARDDIVSYKKILLPEWYHKI